MTIIGNGLVYLGFILGVFPVFIDWHTGELVYLEKIKFFISPSKLNLKGDFYTTNIKLLNVETAAVEKSQKEDLKTISKMNDLIKRVSVLSTSNENFITKAFLYAEEEIVNSGKVAVV